MTDNTIVWGACWYYESCYTLIQFLSNASKLLEKHYKNSIIVVFDADATRSHQQRDEVESSIQNCILIKNNINIYPNKNFGVAAIVKTAEQLNADYVAIVDPDWSVVEYSELISILLKPLVEHRADVVIPNIGDMAGRCNLLIGKPVIQLFYPEYVDTVRTAFPGICSGTVTSLQRIVSSNRYHYDWGGEWDIFALSCLHGFEIASPEIQVVNMRHRSNSSKMEDAFQIWRAVFCHITAEQLTGATESYASVSPPESPLLPFYSSSFIELSLDKQLQYMYEYNVRGTLVQLFYMVLTPIKSLLGGCIPSIDPIDMGQNPYTRGELDELSKFIPYFVSRLLWLQKVSAGELIHHANNLKGGYWSDWTCETQASAINEVCHNPDFPRLPELASPKFSYRVQ